MHIKYVVRASSKYGGCFGIEDTLKKAENICVQMSGGIQLYRKSIITRTMVVSQFPIVQSADPELEQCGVFVDGHGCLEVRRGNFINLDLELENQTFKGFEKIRQPSTVS